MEKRLLGRSGLWVSTLALGAGQFGSFGDVSEDDCIRVAHCAFDGGINLIDTSDFYSFGESEMVVGKAIADRRDKVFISTKTGMPLSEDPNDKGGSRGRIMRSVDASLKRLGTDYIDLYQLHQPDAGTAIEETVDTLNNLVKAGKIRYFGTSNFTAALVTEAVFTARLRGLGQAHSEQDAYSIFERRPEGELLPACEKYGLGFLAFSPLEGGWLSGRYRKGVKAHKSARQRFRPAHYDADAEHNRHKLDAIEALVAVAETAELPLSTLALSFVLGHRAVTSAIIGGTKIEYIQQHLAAADVRLPDDVMDAIDAISPPGRSLTGTHPSTPALLDKALRRRPQLADLTTVGPGHAIQRMFVAGDEEVTS